MSSIPPLSNPYAPSSAGSPPAPRGRWTAVKRIGVVSLAKVMGILYLIFGLIFGFIGTMVVIGAAALGGGGNGADIAVAVGMGVGYMVVLPLIYGMIGVTAGLILGGVYNLVARTTGGIELQLDALE